MTHQYGPSSHYHTGGFEEITPRIQGRHEDTPEAWATEVNRSIAAQIREWRKNRRLSAQQLSERCARIGYAIPRNIIANIETGRRGTISVVEVLALAMALNVPPTLLLFPVGRTPVMHTAPLRDTRPGYAIKWFAGEVRPQPGMTGLDQGTKHGDASREWDEAHDVFIAHQRHDSLVRRYRYVRDDAVAELKRMANPLSQEHNTELDRVRQRQAELLARDLAEAIDLLRRHRQAMNEHGYVVPALPRDIDLGQET